MEFVDSSQSEIDTSLFDSRALSLSLPLTMVGNLTIRCSYMQEDDDDDDGKGAPRTDRVRRGSLYIVLEYLEHDLAGLLDLNIA